MTGRPLNKFKQAVQGNELERVPSYRDWQTNRLQSGKNSLSNSPKIKNEHGKSGNARDHKLQHTVELNSAYDTSVVETAGAAARLRNGNDRVQPHAIISDHPVTYAPSANRTAPNTAIQQRQHRPYAISSSDGRSNYEARTHLQRTYEPTRAHQGQWQQQQQQRTPQHPSQYQAGRLINDHPPNYDTYASVSSAVPPSQLREALERVAVSSNQARHQVYNDSVDTVV